MYMCVFFLVGLSLVFGSELYYPLCGNMKDYGSSDLSPSLTSLSPVGAHGGTLLKPCSYHFDGTNEIEIPHDSMFDDLTEWTLMFWARIPNALVGGQTVFSIENQFDVVKNPKRFEFGFTRMLGEFSSFNPNVDLFLELDEDVFKHYSFVHRPSNSYLLFVDGVSKTGVHNPNELCPTCVTSSVNPLFIGGNSVSQQFVGDIAMVSFYDYALLPEEANQKRMCQVNFGYACTSCTETHDECLSCIDGYQNDDGECKSYVSRKSDLMGYYPLLRNTLDYSGQMAPTAGTDPDDTWAEGTIEQYYLFDRDFWEKIDIDNSDSVFDQLAVDSTVSFWLYRVDDQNSAIFSVDDGFSNRQYWVTINSGYIFFYVYDDSDGEIHETSSTHPIPMNEWTHIVTVKEDGDVIGRIFVNGFEVFGIHNTQFNNGKASTTLPVRIGAGGGDIPFFTGGVAKVMIYDSSFLGPEVMALYYCQVNNDWKCIDCLGDTCISCVQGYVLKEGECVPFEVVYYPFCGNGKDYSGNNYHADTFQTAKSASPQRSPILNPTFCSYEFDGGQEILINDYPEFNNVIEFTVSWWASFDDLGLVGQVFGKDGINQYYIYQRTNRFDVGITKDDEYSPVGFKNRNVDMDNNPALEIATHENEVMHYLITFDGDTFELYINGVITPYGDPVINSDCQGSCDMVTSSEVVIGSNGLDGNFLKANLNRFMFQTGHMNSEDVISLYECQNTKSIGCLECDVGGDCIKCMDGYDLHLQDCILIFEKTVELMVYYPLHYDAKDYINADSEYHGTSNGVVPKTTHSEFTGTDSITIPNTNSYFSQIIDESTLSMWVQINDGNYILFSISNDDDDVQYVLEVNKPKVTVTIFDEGRNKLQQSTSYEDLADSLVEVWKHIVILKEPAKTHARIFIDGFEIEVVESTLDSPGNAKGPIPVRIGSGVNDGFTGNIKRVEIYSVALTEGDINAMFIFHKERSWACLEHFSVCTKCVSGMSGDLCDTASQCEDIDFFDPLVCNGRGVCDSPTCDCEDGYTPDDYCKCPENYSGDDCEVTTCDGVSSDVVDQTLLCNNHGNCTSYNTCSCEDGYTPDDYCKCPENYSGDDCDITTCDGVSSDVVDQTLLCNNHGNCTSYNTCSCEDGYTPGDYCKCPENYSGDDCDVTTCDGVSSDVVDQTLLCFNHGDCIGYNICECEGGYNHETYCETLEDDDNDDDLDDDSDDDSDDQDDDSDDDSDDLIVGSCDELEGECQNDGVCVKVKSDWVCDCSKTGYSGPYCNIPICTPECNANASSVCEGPDKCSKCDEGFYGPTCYVIECYNFLSNDTENVCSGVAECIDYNKCYCDITKYAGNMCEINLIGQLENAEKILGYVGAGVGVLVAVLGICLVLFLVVIICYRRIQNQRKRRIIKTDYDLELRRQKDTKVLTDKEKRERCKDLLKLVNRIGEFIKITDNEGIQKTAGMVLLNLTSLRGNLFSPHALLVTMSEQILHPTFDVLDDETKLSVIQIFERLVGIIVVFFNKEKHDVIKDFEEKLVIKFNEIFNEFSSDTNSIVKLRICTESKNCIEGLKNINKSENDFQKIYEGVKNFQNIKTLFGTVVNEYKKIGKMWYIKLLIMRTLSYYFYDDYMIGKMSSDMSSSTEEINKLLHMVPEKVKKNNFHHVIGSIDILLELLKSIEEMTIQRTILGSTDEDGLKKFAHLRSGKEKEAVKEIRNLMIDVLGEILNSGNNVDEKIKEESKRVLIQRTVLETEMKLREKITTVNSIMNDKKMIKDESENCAKKMNKTWVEIVNTDMTIKRRREEIEENTTLIEILEKEIKGLEKKMDKVAYNEICNENKELENELLGIEKQLKYCREEQVLRKKNVDKKLKELNEKKDNLQNDIDKLSIDLKKFIRLDNQLVEKRKKIQELKEKIEKGKISLEEKNEENELSKQMYETQKGNLEQIQRDHQFAIKLQQEFIKEKNKRLEKNGEKTKDIKHYIQDYVVEEEYSEEVPQEFTCPISLEIMTNPVLLIETGQTYEKENIETWFKNGNKTDPVSNKKLSKTGTVINYTLKGMISDWKASHKKK